MRRLKRVGTVVFDCDSTLSSIEGIEELARGHALEVARLTEAAMNGELPLEEVYGRRLELVQPTRDQVERLGELYAGTAVADARATVAALLEEGFQVRIISGGLRRPVAAFGATLGIPAGRIAAVDVEFDEDGRYRGYDAASPLARAGGKREVIALWRHEAPPPIMLVGDGATDLEASAAVDVFVGYAGVVARPAVMAGADIVLRSESLAPVLPLALGGAPPRVPSNRPLFDRGVALLDADVRRYLGYTPTSELNDA
jgi:phosphoserine phosphatase